MRKTCLHLSSSTHARRATLRQRPKKTPKKKQKKKKKNSRESGATAGARQAANTSAPRTTASRLSCQTHQRGATKKKKKMEE
jgi:hypothetical protein